MGKLYFIKIKRDNKLHALETLARIHNMFYNNQDQNTALKERVIYHPFKVLEGSPVNLTAHSDTPTEEDDR